VVTDGWHNAGGLARFRGNGFGAVLVVGAVLLLPQDRLARIAADQIEAATGRAVTISGQPRVSLWPVLGVATGPMALANAPWAADSGPLLQADSLKISVDVAGLLQGAVRITGFEAVNPVIRLQRTADGRENWRLASRAWRPRGRGPGRATRWRSALIARLLPAARCALKMRALAPGWPMTMWIS